MKENNFNQNEIYFERVRFYHYPIIRYFLNKNFKVFIFSFHLEARKIGWLRPMLDDDRVIMISHFIFGSGSIALKNIKVLEPFVLKSNLLRAITKLYGNEKIKMAYQKTLVKCLSDFHSVQLVLKGADCRKIVFFPFSYFKIYSIIKRYKGLIEELDNVEIPCLFKFLNAIDLFFGQLKSWLIANGVNFIALVLLLMKFVYASPKRPKKEYIYAVAITNSYFQFKFAGHRAFDFILDGKQINKENTVFLAFNPVNSGTKHNLDVLGYHILDCRRQEVFFLADFRLSRTETLFLIVKGIEYALKNLYFSLFESEDNIYSSHILFKTYLLWSIILARLKLKHFITFNDEGISHIGRNILLNQNGAETWHYAHSCSFGYSQVNHDMSPTLFWLWMFLLYDHYIAWNKPTIEFQKLHNQSIGQYHNVGCIWSGFEINGRDGGGVSEILLQAKIKGKDSRGFKVVSFFDTSFLDRIFGDYPLKDGIRFYSDIERFLNEEPGIFVIVKEKKDRRMYSDERCFVYSKLYKEFFAKLEILQSHPRCFVAGHDFNPGAIIRVSDLTVTYAFSSITVEALGAGRRAIFYDPTARFQGYFYDVIPGFVAHGYEELKLFINEMLAMSESEFTEFMNVWASPRIEDYRDGKAVNRFRELLADGNKQ